MPNPAILFRMSVFFLLFALVVVAIFFLLAYWFGIEFGFFTKVAQWRREQKQKVYDDKFRSMQYPYDGKKKRY